MYHIIVNPVAGHSKAEEFVTTQVIPLLDHLGLPHQIYLTKAEKDAGNIGRQIRTSSRGEEVKVIIAGGDGTAHAMIEGILEDVDPDKQRIGRWELIVLPLGTANALFYSLFPQAAVVPMLSEPIQTYFTDTSISQETIYKLSSLISSLISSKPTRLPITSTRLISPSSPTPKPIPSHIVLSTSLHASLLADSESLRASYPGIERFKIAAEQNLGVFFRANVTLIPPKDGSVKQYQPTSEDWVEPFTTTSTGVNGTFTLKGPFTYLLSSTTAPRLEPSFVISPLLATLPPNPQDNPTMDITILRPSRDPAISQSTQSLYSEEISERWKKRAKEVLGWAYKEGGHVDLTYSGEGEAEIRGDGEVVAETFRCAGFIWEPIDPDHAPSHVVCADGSIYTIPQGGRAEVSITEFGKEGQDGFWVYGS